MSNGLDIATLRDTFSNPPLDSRPMMRWWWFGPTVQRAELDRELQAIADAGFGGVEVSYVYPLEPAECDLLAPEFLAHLRFAADRAKELGLRFDLTLGSGWSFGGPHITPELAASKLHWERREIQPPALDVPVAAPWPGDQLVAAFIGGGSIQEPPQNCTELPIVDGLIKIPPGVGTRQVLLAYARPTGQNVKRAAAGAEGPVHDHYSAAAALRHIEAFAEPLLAAVPAELIGSVFCDSLEVYESDWTPELLAEFEKRRGYDLRESLYLLIITGEGSAQVRADYFRTLTELYEENFVAVFQRWAAGRGVRFRIQGYGTPPATVSSYRFADLFEGEGWGWREIARTRWASSAAHLYGQDVVSSEVWTWVHSPSFRATPLDLQGEAHEHFLLGINQLVGHGWPYSPADAPGLGWFFYAAGALDDRNPWWPAMPHLNAYLHRLSWLLRQGSPVADVKLYLPAADIAQTMGTQQGGTLDLWREAFGQIGPEIPRVIRERGLDFDLIDDDATLVLSPDAAPVVVLPFAVNIPAETRKWLAEVLAAGGVVVSVGGGVVDGAVQVDIDAFAEALDGAIARDVVLTPESGEIGMVHRRGADCDLYFLANTGKETQSFTFTTKTPRARFEEWSAVSGSVVRSGALDTAVKITLHAYEGTVIACFDSDITDQAGAEPRELSRRSIDGPWQVEFLDGVGDSAAKTVELPHQWEADEARAGYSGGAAYQVEVEVSEVELAPGQRVLIDFGDCQAIDAKALAEEGIRGSAYRVAVTPPVREIVEVIVNDASCGVLWAPPYRLDLTDYLRPGPNELRLVVHNTAANALSVETAICPLVKESTARYGQRFVMQDLDKAMDGVESGLLSVPQLVVLN